MGLNPVAQGFWTGSKSRNQFFFKWLLQLFQIPGEKWILAINTSLVSLVATIK
jgi:hypothetical protein